MDGKKSLGDSSKIHAMRIVLVAATLNRAGGAEEYLFDLFLKLRQIGHEVFVLYGKEKKTDLAVEAIGDRGIFIQDFRESKMLEELAKINPDVVNFQNVIEAKALERVSHEYPTTVFLHDHHSYCPGNSKLWFGQQSPCSIATSFRCAYHAYREKCMTRKPWKIFQEIWSRQEELAVLRTLPVVLCNSHYVAQQLVGNGLSAEKVVVNHLFPRSYRRESAEPPTPSAAEPLVLFVGRLFKEKGVNHFLKALQILGDFGHALVAGDGWEKENLLLLSKKLGLESRVEFVGFCPREELGEIYRKTRVLVVPSLWPEPFGMVGLEAFSFGVPVVAYRSGGIGEWLVDRENGLLVARGRVEELAQAIGQLVRDEALARSYGRAGMKLAADRFHIDRHVGQLLSIYRTLI